MLDVVGITRSPSRPGNPYDNAVVESTNRLVKKELIHRNVYTNVEQLVCVQLVVAGLVTMIFRV